MIAQWYKFDYGTAALPPSRLPHAAWQAARKSQCIGISTPFFHYPLLRLFPIAWARQLPGRQDIT